MKIISKTCSALLALVVVCAVMAGCGGGGSQSNSLQISVASGSVMVGSTAQLRAMRANGSGTLVDVTNSVTWTSSQVGVATISPAGVLSSLTMGTTSISAVVDTASGVLTLAVAGPPLTALTINPLSSTVPVGYTQQFTASGVYGDGSAANLPSSSSLVWSVSPSTNATIDQTGLLTATAVGSYTVTATVGTITATSSGTATDAVLTSVGITPTGGSIPEGSSRQFTATATFSDGSTLDESASATWSSSNTAVLTINSTGLATAKTQITPSSVTVFAQVGSDIASTPVNVVQAAVATAELTSIVVTPTSSSLAAHTGQQLTATGYYADGSTEDVTSDVTWSSDNTASSAVDDTGMVLTGTPGEATITASIVVPVSARKGEPRPNATQTLTSTTVSLVTSATLVSIQAETPVPTLAISAEQPLQAVGVFSDGTKQDITILSTWSSSDSTIASVTAGGVVTGVAVGSASFVASFNGQTATTPAITITNAVLQNLTLSVVSSTLIAHHTVQITVYGNYSDGTRQDLSDQATFTTSDPTIFPIDDDGNTTGLQAGQATITASALGQSATLLMACISATLQSITIVPHATTLALGTTYQLQGLATFSDGVTTDLTGEFVWGSSNPAVFTVASGGLLKSGSLGTATVTASLLGVTTASGSVQVTAATLTDLVISPATVQLAYKTNQQFTAVGVFSDGTVQDVTPDVVWTSSNPPSAEISSTGYLTAVAAGTPTITATLLGKTATTSAVTITNANIVSATIVPRDPVLALGTSEQTHLIATFDDDTTQDVTGCALFTTSNPSVISVALGGLIRTATAAGTSTVGAICGTTGASTNVTSVAKTLNSIAIVPSQAEVAIGGAQEFALVGTFSDGTTEEIDINVTWGTSNPEVAALYGGYVGNAIGVTTGNSTISATYEGLTAPTAVLHVNPKTLSSLQVTPPTATLVAGATQQFTAQATYSDATGGDISNLVAWTSSNPTLVSVDETGLATAQTSTTGGTANITATTGTFSSSAVVTVPVTLTDTLVSIQVVPTSSKIAAGTPEQLTAMGTYQDGTTQDISSSVLWTSSNPAEATVSTTGVVTGVAPGMVTVQAQSGTLQSQSTVIVTAATLVSVAVSPSGATFANGTNQQFKLIGTFSDGTTQDLSNGAVWTSSNTAAATISQTGLATGVGVGSTVFSSTFDGQTASTSPSQVTSATLVSIAVQPNSGTYAKGTSQQFKVVGSYSDGTTEDLSSMATWQSSDPTVINISSTGLGTGVGAGTATITAVAGGQTTTSGAITITSPTLTSISITPGTPSFAAGTNQQFIAMGTFSDGSTTDLTNQVVWASANPSVATINSSGLATSGAAGTTQITASYQGVSAMTGTVTVTGATLTGFTITPTSGTVAKGTTQQFTATGTFSDGSTQNLSNQVQWSTSNSTALAISSTGLATGVGTGTASVSATYGGQTVTTSAFTVSPATLTSVAITPATASIASGGTEQYTLTGTFSDGSMQNLGGSTSWSSSSSAIATINSTGVATGTGVGTATITGQSGSQTATAQLTVTAASLISLAVTPDSATIPKGTTLQFTATATYGDGSMQNVSSTTTWISSNSNEVVIDANGLATAVSDSGSVNITARYGGQTFTTGAVIASAALLASITVSPANDSLVIASTQQYTATGNYTDGSTGNLTTLCTWTSSTTSVATINGGGLATAVGAGSTTIQAQDGTVSGTTPLTVTSAPVTAQSLVITPSSASIPKGTTQQFKAAVQYSDGSTQDVTSQTTWQSATTTVATINSSGLATGVTGGSTQITGTYSTFSASVQLTVSPATLTGLAVTPQTASIADGTTQQFTATGTLSDGSTENISNSVNWTSNNTTDATISGTGLATAHTSGSTTITAQSGTITSNSATLTITNATVSSISAQPTSYSAAAGYTQQLQVTANFSDGTSQNVTQSSTYASSAPNIATVSSGGLITTVAQGAATITVTSGSNSTTVPVAVSAATLSSIAVTPTPLSLAAGSTQQLTATGTYSDGSTANITSTVTWSSSATNVLTVSTTGLLTSTTAGNATVTATLGSKSGTLAVTVTSAVIQSISVTPATSTLAAGQTQQYTAIATLSDGTQQTVTTSAHWSVSDPTRATISNTSGTNGVLTSIASGTDTIYAAVGSVTGQATVTISTATLTSIAVTPGAFTLAQGTTQQLVVTGTYSDNSTQILTVGAVYSTNSATTATVSSGGLVTATGVAGVATITAAVGTVTGTATVTALPDTLLAVAVTPATVTIAKGLTEQFTATGTYVGNQQNITSQVTWTSSNPAIATITSAGVAKGVAAGTVTITATSGTMSGTATLTVGAGTLQSITVTSIQSSFPLGQQLQMTATGNYSDGTTQNLTSLVTWTSLNPSVGVVSTAGVSSGVKAGVFGAQATYGGLTGSTTLTVTNATLQTITVTPANDVLVNLTPVQYDAVGHFSDGTTLDITNNVHWSTTPGLLGIQVGTINQSGQLTATAVGAGTVNASQGTITGSTGFVVASL
jgi:uncharacterized protein YjdB